MTKKKTSFLEKEEAIVFEAREKTLRDFARNFEKDDKRFAKAVRVMCRLPSDQDEASKKVVAAMLGENEESLAARLQYLAVKTTDVTLGRSGKQTRGTLDEGYWKQRDVLSLYYGG